MIHGEMLTTLRDVVERLNRLRLGFMVTGSLALGYYVEPRMTRDIDLVIDLETFDPEAFVSSFRNGYYIPEEMVLSATKPGSMFNLIREKEVVKIDFVVRREGDFRAGEFERRRVVRVGGIECPIVSAEDLILSKLLWREQSGSDLQLRDVRALLDIDGIDVNYLTDWARRLGVAEKLAEQIDEA